MDLLLTGGHGASAPPAGLGLQQLQRQRLSAALCAALRTGPRKKPALGLRLSPGWAGLSSLAGLAPSRRSGRAARGLGGAGAAGVSERPGDPAAGQCSRSWGHCLKDQAATPAPPPRGSAAPVGTLTSPLGILFG